MGERGGPAGVRSFSCFFLPSFLFFSEEDKKEILPSRYPPGSAICFGRAFFPVFLSWPAFCVGKRIYISLYIYIIYIHIFFGGWGGWEFRDRFTLPVYFFVFFVLEFACWGGGFEGCGVGLGWGAVREREGEKPDRGLKSVVGRGSGG